MNYDVRFFLVKKMWGINSTQSEPLTTILYNLLR